MRYDTSDENGETRRDRNERFGVNPGPEPSVPDAVDYVWQWFWQLNSRRQRSESGPQPISHFEIRAWMENTGALVTREEIDMLTAMDSAFLSKSAEETNARRESQKDKAPSPKPKPRML